jgi:hypothetical protein
VQQQKDAKRALASTDTPNPTPRCGRDSNLTWKRKKQINRAVHYVAQANSVRRQGDCRIQSLAADVQKNPKKSRKQQGAERLNVRMGGSVPKHEAKSIMRMCKNPTDKGCRKVKVKRDKKQVPPKNFSKGVLPAQILLLHAPNVPFCVAPVKSPERCVDIQMKSPNPKSK